jgi:dimethylamine monooxygenase subunit A
MEPVGATVATPPYLPFMDGPAPAGPEAFRWRLGVRPLDLHDWIELGPDADAAIEAKARLMAEHPTTVFAVLDERVSDEGREVADALVEHLHHRWPERYGHIGLDPTLHPLDAAARLVPEDLVLLVERDGRLVFGGGSVCFPNRWDLRSKLGLTMAGVHAPVDRLNDQLEAPIDSFFERLTPQRSFWRLGWGVLDTADWYTPLDGTAGPRPVSPRPEQMYLRVERETLRRFPDTGCVLFTIRTYVTPILQASSSPEVARRLAAAIDSLPSDVRTYKDLVSVGDALADRIRARPSDPNPDTLILKFIDGIGRKSWRSTRRNGR